MHITGDIDMAETEGLTRAEIEEMIRDFCRQDPDYRNMVLADLGNER